MIDDLLARCAFPGPGSIVACAVSGGPDSLALLALARAAGCEVTAIHVDHGLRPGSANEAHVVAEAAERFGAAFSSETAVVEDGPNLEARAREARRAVLPPDALFGHTMEDQVETVLLNLLRGAGPSGLVAMHGDRRRPILRLRRAETQALCGELGLEPVEDPSNEDARFRRNRIRHEVLPLLDDVAERDIVPVIARQSALVAAEQQVLEALAAGLEPTDATALRAAQPAIARRVLRRWIMAETAAAHPPDAATIDRALAVARLDAVATDLGGGWRLARTDNVLRLDPPAASPGKRLPSDG